MKHPNKNYSYIVTPADNGISLRKLLKKELRLSSKNINSLIEQGTVLVNHRKECYGSARLKCNDLIEWTSIPEQISLKFKFDEKQIIYENRDFFIYNKPPGIPCQRTRDAKRENLEDAINQWRKNEGLAPLILTHRLDRDTSGVILFAKHLESSKKAFDWFKHREVKKTYLAISYAQIKKIAGCWKHYLKLAGNRRGQSYYHSVKSGGQVAITDYQTLDSKNSHTLWELHPHTGRTHQLRVQLSHFGFPIVGDQLYDPSFQKRPNIEHHLLHADRLQLPFTPQVFKATPPPLFKSFCLQQQLKMPS